MLRDSETAQLLDAACDLALAICTAPDPCALVEPEIAEVYARQHGLKTNLETQAVLALALIMVERKGPLIKLFREDYALAASRPESGIVQ
ncbi:hypothetical protein [Mesorhizobium sp. IMUNJ 23232]|uniref:hypothetical protein n=1 Tax=Mesorhizobium sp. IMUNJ 23232 TaxID=3376064 RepID=UPI00379494B5